VVNENQRYYELFNKLKSERPDHSKLTANSNVLIVDGLNTFIRTWCAIPTQNEHGDHIGGTTGFLTSVGYAIRQFKPTRVIIAFDGKDGSASRKKIYSEYKANRGKNRLSRVNRVYGQLSDNEERRQMKRQLQITAKILSRLPVSLMLYPRVEADDVIGYVSRKLCKERSIIMSSDKDFLQLVDDETTVWSPTKKKLYTKESLYEEYGIPNENFLLFRMIDGDASDNIGGIKGIALKTLIKRFPIITGGKISMTDLLEYAQEQVDGGSKIKVYSTLLESADILKRNKKLMNLEKTLISGALKLKIVDNFNSHIPELNRLELQKKLIKEGMIDAMPSLPTWIQSTFKTLDRYAHESNG